MWLGKLWFYADSVSIDSQWSELPFYGETISWAHDAACVCALKPNWVHSTGIERVSGRQARFYSIKGVYCCLSSLLSSLKFLTAFVRELLQVIYQLQHLSKLFLRLSYSSLSQKSSLSLSLSLFTALSLSLCLTLSFSSTLPCFTQAPTSYSTIISIATSMYEYLHYNIYFSYIFSFIFVLSSVFSVAQKALKQQLKPLI